MVDATADADLPALSPWGPEDQIGRMNLITPESRLSVMSELDAGKVFDISVDFFVGMPSWQAAGDLCFQQWMSHTPRGTIVENVVGTAEDEDARVGYSGDSISMYVHTGTHIDTLCHFSRYGYIWNRFSEKQHLGSRHWTKCGADQLPPIIARGVLLDVAGMLGIDMLPQGYGVSVQEIKDTLKRQGTELRQGDVVITRTGRMRIWPDFEQTMVDSPGISLPAARYLVEEGGAIMLGGDNVSVEQMPSAEPDNWIPVHCYCFQDVGVNLLEFANVEELAAEEIYEFGFMGFPLKIRGTTGTPVRPVCIPFRK